jgi:hypothetical protein
MTYLPLDNQPIPPSAFGLRPAEPVDPEFPNIVRDITPRGVTIKYRKGKVESIFAVVSGLPWSFSFDKDGLHISVPHASSKGTQPCAWGDWLKFSRDELIPYLLINSTELNLHLSEQAPKPPALPIRPALATLAADAAAAAQRIEAAIAPPACVCCDAPAPLVPDVDLDICEMCYNVITAAWFEEMQEYSDWAAEEILR